MSADINTDINIDKDLCKGCDICITFCPKNVYEKSKIRNKRGSAIPYAARPEDCVSCKICERFCPDMAISVTKQEEKVKKSKTERIDDAKKAKRKG